MRAIAALLAVLTLIACPARADQEKIGRRPPHYAGRPVTGGAAAGLVRGPVLAGGSFQAPGPQRALLEVIEARRAAFEAALDSLAGPVAAGLAADFADGAPAVYAGSPDGFYAPERLGPDDDAELPRDAVYLRITDPGGDWKKRARAAAAGSGATHVLVVALELSDYPVSQKSWKGDKAIDLAAGHTVPVPWLTSLDQPVEVVQWTGALYRADGRFVRGGAEAFAALRTRFMESAAGLQRTMTAGVLEEAFTATREDLPGAPQAWRTALANLIAELTGRPREGESRHVR